MHAPRRKRGRPPIDATDPTSTSLSIRLPTKQYDLACARALERRQTLAEYVREAVEREKDR